ncbi:septal ring lytic transglycosylase RlpA family protein [Alkalilimnicola ehrlichii MLHE-1]|uniref:Endolytic peptidoglycan transglycosylase RlpA n=1 Tax=Alkalilimnicola ehrlichii (strain ATCC BAA-1101 / DSM 17681 / MLHE-1) TaxID=187272 RepID=Q0ACA7_ALKEH|nr:septal ring lytic transglycosylase RlpA family protein [Alkalilimnicola ehrlichii]ABI55530.1 rare lipoprotein A [Alkalilimnicola ehrlichii MLHE-1]
MRRLIPFALLLALFLTGCSTVSGPSGEEGGPFAGRSPDGGPSNPPDLSQVPDAVPRDEPRARYGNPARYEVFGQTYYVKDSAEGYDQEGIASWYGTKFHGRRTSSGEPYDMYAMTAAHRSLPLPTYAEVTNLDNGKRVVVRINDRGPFVDNRIIDLSYAAATRLDMVDAGTAPVRVRTVTAADSLRTARPGDRAPAGDAQAASTVPDDDGADAAGLPAVALPEGERLVVTSGEDAPEAAANPSRDNGAEASGRYFLQLGAFGQEANARRLRDELDGKLSAPVAVHSANGVHRVKVGPLADMGAVDQAHGELERQGLRDFHLVER